MSSKHIFAFYVPSLQDITLHNQITITQKELIARLTTVLRLTAGHMVHLFDTTHNLLGTITEISHKKILIVPQAKILHQPCRPEIVFLVPLLKRDAFHESVYSLTQLGITVIQPINTRKTHRASFDAKEQSKLEKICIAAAEQSKQFILPIIEEPMSLQQAIKTHAGGSKIFFDPDGQPLLDTVTQLGNISQKFILLVGPEADLSPDEKEFVIGHGFIATRLTSTILRAQDAITIAAGALRSLF